MDRDVERKAARAREILSDELFLDTVQDVRDRIFREWSTSRPEETYKRERLYLELKAMERLIGGLHGHVMAERMEMDREKQKDADFGIA